MASEQLVVFQLATEEYAIPISQVKEIIQHNRATKLPDMPEYMDGIINLRERIIPVIDLARRFAIATESKASNHTLIVEVEDKVVGLVVDVVTEVIRLDEFAMEDVKGVEHKNEYIRSIGKKGDRLLIILDLSNLMLQTDFMAESL